MHTKYYSAPSTLILEESIVKYNVTAAEGMTMRKLEHVVVDNKYATTKDDQFGDVRSVHVGFQEHMHL